MSEKMNQALAFLREKYGCPAGEIVNGNAGPELVLPDGKKIRLLPWRVERRFVELKKIIDGKTLEDVSTFRFASFSAGGDPVKTAARELDLAAYLADSPIQRIFAVRSGNAACNILARFANGMSASVECGSKLPAGADPMDRHEIIARRGVASDRTVDTQVPQASIYEFTADGEKRYTDTDTELFGFALDEILTIRAAFAVLSEPSLAPAWNAIDAKVTAQVAAALESDKTRKPVSC